MSIVGRSIWSSVTRFITLLNRRKPSGESPSARALRSGRVTSSGPHHGAPLSPHRYRQGGYSAIGMQNSHRTKKIKMRNTNPEIHEQDAGERVEVPQGSLLTALAWQPLFTQGIAQLRASIQTRLVIASKSDPTAGGLMRQAHSPRKQSQSVSST
jgi:hypothetical protein